MSAWWFVAIFCLVLIAVWQILWTRQHNRRLTRHMEDVEEIYRTKSGRVLTDEDFERLADEAERGYDVEKILKRRAVPPMVKPTSYRDLTERELKHISEHATCPYCGSDLYDGPEGGLSINVLCSNKDCRARFNVARGGPDGLFAGQFTMTESADLEIYK